MKNEDKKVPDAPKRLWVQTNSLIHDTGLTAVGNVFIQRILDRTQT